MKDSIKNTNKQLLCFLFLYPFPLSKHPTAQSVEKFIEQSEIQFVCLGIQVKSCVHFVAALGT